MDVLNILPDSGRLKKIGLPHRLMKDDVYNGKYLPAGTLVSDGHDQLEIAVSINLIY